MAAIARRIDKLIKSALVPMLEPLGFSRKARNFWRRQPSFIGVVNLQGNKWNEGDSGSFTLNFGVYFPELAKVLGAAVCDSPDEAECHVRERGGMLLDPPGDRWWELGPGRDEVAVAEEVSALVKERGLRWIDDHADCMRLSETLLAQRPVLRAAILHVSGQSPQAAALIEAHVRKEPLRAHPWLPLARAMGLEKQCKEWIAQAREPKF